MNFYDLLVDIFADDKPFSYLTALVLILGTVFSAYITMNRSAEYMKYPDTDGFKPVKKAGNIASFFSFFLFQWCIFAAVYLLTKARIGEVSTVYTMITVLSVGAVIFTIVAKSKYTKAKNMYNSLYLKANRGNLNALMGNPLGLDGGEQDAVNSILIGAVGKSIGGITSDTFDAGEKNMVGTVNDPLNDILRGAVEIDTATPAEAAMENLEQSAMVSTRECPFCKKQVEKKYPLCIYCGMPIPDREKDYRSNNKELEGWEKF